MSEHTERIARVLEKALPEIEWHRPYYAELLAPLVERMIEAGMYTARDYPYDDSQAAGWDAALRAAEGATE